MTRRSTTLSDALFYTSYTIWLVLMIANTSLYANYIGSVYAVVRMTCLLLLALKEIVDMRYTNTSVSGFLVAACMIGCGLAAADTAVVDGMAFIVCARSKDFTSLLKLSVRVTLAALAFIILSSFIGLISNYTGWVGGRQRSYLGFRYALYPSSYLFFSSCAIVYLRKEKLTLVQSVAISVCNVVMYHFTQSRISFILSLLVVLAAYVLAVVLRKRPERSDCGEAVQMHRILAAICSSAYALATFISFSTASLYSSSNPFFASLDSSELLGGRLGISHDAIISNGLRLFGREMHFSGAALGASGLAPTYEHYNYIDNFYIKVALNYGVVFLLFFLALETKLLWRACRYRDYFLVIILIATAMHCVIDNAALHLYYNPFLFLMGGMMTVKKDSRKLR